MEQKRQLIKVVFQNLRLDGRTVRYDYAKPFDQIFFYADRKLWLPEPCDTILPDFDGIISAFQHVGYMGELKQRWSEIKKLQREPAYIAV